MSDSFGFIYFIYFIKHEKENLEDLRALPMHETINSFYSIGYRTKKLSFPVQDFLQYRTYVVIETIFALLMGYE